MKKKHYIIPIFVPMEGCPHQCVFCNQNKITGIQDTVDKYKVREIVEEYLSTMNKKESTIEISFFGGTFTAIKESKQRELLQVAKDYKDRGLIHKIRMSTRPDAINDYILSYLKEYKADIIELGVQSMDNEVLLAAGRGHTVEDIIRASQLIKKYGFTLGHQIMPGLPKDSFQKDIKSTIESIKLKPDIVRIYPALVIKDTPMALMYNRGEYIPYTLDEAVEISSRMCQLYEDNNVKVIRVGLQPTDTIKEGGDVIGGPFHPAFRELVEALRYTDIIKSKINNSKEGTIIINPKEISKLYANKKYYYNQLINEGYKIKVKTCELIKPGDIVIN